MEFPFQHQHVPCLPQDAILVKNNVKRQAKGTVNDAILHRSDTSTRKKLHQPLYPSCNVALSPQRQKHNPRQTPPCSDKSQHRTAKNRSSEERNFSDGPNPKTAHCHRQTPSANNKDPLFRWGNENSIFPSSRCGRGARGAESGPTATCRGAA